MPDGRRVHHQNVSSGGRLGLSRGASPAPGDDQNSLRAFQEAINATALTSSFVLRPSLLGAASTTPASPLKPQQSRRSQGTHWHHQRVSGLNYMGASNLAARLGEKPCVGVVIDMRKSADYVSSHIVSAIGMTVPTTLVKRPHFSVQRLLAMLHAPEAQKQQLAQWKQAPWIAIYGEGWAEDTASSEALLVLLAKKFMAEAPDTCRVYVLEGGYGEFSRQYPELCEVGSDGRGPAAAPAPVESKPAVDLDHPMLRKMRQTPGGGGDANEVIFMRMPPEFAALRPSSTEGVQPDVGCAKLTPMGASAAGLMTPRGVGSLDEMQLNMLPGYLRLVADPETGPGVLTKLFKHLDSAEVQRLATMIDSRGVVTEANQFTISAGIELGSKNRYTNILPFDSNRVRLQQRRRGRPADTGNINKPLPPLPPLPPGTPVGGISGSAAHLRLRMQGDRPVSYDHAAATGVTGPESQQQNQPLAVAKRSSHVAEMSRRGRALLEDDDDSGKDEQRNKAAGSLLTVLAAATPSVGAGGSSGGSDYINASFLSYFGGPVYIAAQGPLAETAGDFWHMVWEQKTRVVVMLTRGTEHGRAKCHQYWPDDVGRRITCGDIDVTWEAEALHPDDHSVVARRFRLGCGGAAAVVTHLQYLGWPDHGVPDTPLGVLRLRQLARTAQAGAPAPMVVHCSAGCGRTGAFCAIDTLLWLAEEKKEKAEEKAGENTDADGDVSMGNSSDSWVEEPPRELRTNLVFMVVARFREQRMMAVQTGRQFAFCHEALAWALLGVGPRPLDRAIDRRLVAEWNRTNHSYLSPADCVDVTYLMRGRCEMVSAMLQPPAEDGAASRASIDVSALPSAGMAPPMIKRSNTVGAARRGPGVPTLRPVNSRPPAHSPVPVQQSQLRELERELVASIDDDCSALRHQLSAVAEEELSTERALPPLPLASLVTCGAEALAHQQEAAGDYFGESVHASSCSAGQEQTTTPAAAEWRRSAHLHLHQCHNTPGAASNAGASTPPALASPRVK
ncbi:phosphotyrosine-specific ptp2-like protein [Coemansia sp. BCRC 34301]|nr:phosphotyrosine-specific ptp2-like protein [Coemansia sp. BCRC 34301]